MPLEIPATLHPPERLPPSLPPRLLRFYNELKRRRVFGSAAAYVVLGALVIELSGAIFDALLFPAWTARLVTVILILGFPLVLVLAWVFDISSTGLVRSDTPAHGPGSHEGRSVRPRGDLSEAFRRSDAVSVPEAPLRRRRPPGTVVAGGGGPGTGGATMVGGDGDGAAGAAVADADPERVRQATLGHVRHELRTPINGIIGYSEMLMEDVEDPELVADLGRIRESGRRLLDRLDALLRPERLPAGALDDLPAFAAQVEVDLRTPINAVVGYAEMLIECCDAPRHEHLRPDLQRILDAAQRLLAASGDIVGIAAAAGGMAAPAAGSGGRPGASGGNGTGAAVGSVGGAPSSLEASAALTRGVLSKIRTMSPGRSAAEGEGRLLVVDDNETNRDLISRQLARSGYIVATAENGKAALELMDAQSFDLVLLDMIMPVMDGVETLRRIHGSERHQDTPVIMLSSLDEADSAVHCIEMGAADYITKPVQPTLLEARIAAALDLREMRRREAAYRKRIAADFDLLERVLRGTFADAVLDRVLAGDLDICQTWEDVAVVACRLPSALRPAAGADAAEKVAGLRELLARFEEVARTHAVDAVVWRADGFVAVMGAGGTAADAAADAAGLALDTVAAWGEGVAARLAVHTGAVVGGVVGRDRPRFELWGEAVEAAAALAASGPAGSVLVTPGAHALLRDRFRLEARGVMNVAGSGQMRVHALTGEMEGVPTTAPKEAAAP